MLHIWHYLHSDNIFNYLCQRSYSCLSLCLFINTLSKFYCCIVCACSKQSKNAASRTSVSCQLQHRQSLQLHHCQHVRHQERKSESKTMKWRHWPDSALKKSRRWMRIRRIRARWTTKENTGNTLLAKWERSTMKWRSRSWRRKYSHCSSKPIWVTSLTWEWPTLPILRIWPMLLILHKVCGVHIGASSLRSYQATTRHNVCEMLHFAGWMDWSSSTFLISSRLSYLNCS